MNKKLTTFLSILMLFSFCLCGCVGSNKTFLYDDGISDNDSYNSEYFYRNDLDVDWFADPGVLYCTEGEDAGYFFAYGTSSQMGGGFRAYRSKNLSDWESIGVPFVVSTLSWAYSCLWAPEVIYYQTPQEKEAKEKGKYYMYFSAQAKENVLRSEWDNLYLGVAVADSPRGPFKEYASKLDVNNNPIPNFYGETFTEKTPTILFRNHFTEMRLGGVDTTAIIDGKETQIDRFAAIDASPFIDDNGDIYMYFVRHKDTYNTNNTIFGMKMRDPVTPDYSTLTPMASPNYANFKKGDDGFYKGLGTTPTEEGGVNEGPFMQQHISKKPDGTTVKKYYLSYSAHGYSSPLYRVNVAVSDTPLGTFEKLPAGIATPMHGISASFDHMSGTGHHVFINAGEENFIFYHAHCERDHGAGNPRALAVDRVYWAYNEELGYDMYHSNGPTYSLAPVPNVTSKRTNLAVNAKITATNALNSTTLLQDNIVPIHGYNEKQEFRVKNSSTITIKLKKESKISSIFIYNSYRYAVAFDKISKITMTGGGKKYIVNDLMFNPDYTNGLFKRIRPGAAAVMAFDEISVSEITIQVDSKLQKESSSEDFEIIGIGDIAVFGK